MFQSKKIPCKYGDKCYQKNPTHLNKYSHSVKRTPTGNVNNPKVKKVKHSDDNLRQPKLFENNTTETKDDKISETNSAEHTSTKELEDRITDEEINNENAVFVFTGSTFDEKKAFIKEKFLVDMPEDFYSFWDLCESINKDNPKNAFKDIGLTLAGPYDVLADCLPKKDDDNYLLHCRFYYDTPEFQTILIGDSSTGFHLGYFRDSPDEKPCFVGSNYEKKDCVITQMGENVFAAVNKLLNEYKSKANPFEQMKYVKLLSKLQSKAKDLKLDLSNETQTMQKRMKKAVCKSFHAAGIVVPVERKTELGYRNLYVPEKELTKILNRIAAVPSGQRLEAMAELQPVLSATMIANDECDFGTGLQLAIDLFCHGSDCFNNTALRFMNTAYNLLNRGAFGKIASVHLKNRKKLS